MQSLENTNILLTIMRSYATLMTSEEREGFYKNIHKFGQMETNYNLMNEKIEEKIKELENYGNDLDNIFNKIIKDFNDFFDEYEDKCKKAIYKEPDKKENVLENEKISKDKKATLNNKFKTTTEFKDFIKSEEGLEMMNKIFNHLFEEFK